MVSRKEAGIDLDLTETTGSPSVAGKASTKISVDGLFGIYNLLSGPFVAVISRSKLRCGGGGGEAEGERVFWRCLCAGGDLKSYARRTSLFPLHFLHVLRVFFPQVPCVLVTIMMMVMMAFFSFFASRSHMKRAPSSSVLLMAPCVARCFSARPPYLAVRPFVLIRQVR